MIREIIKLQEVQEIDLRIFSLKKLQKELPANLHGMQADVKNKMNAVQALNNELKDIKAHQKNLEVEIQSLKDTVKKYKNQLLQLKSNEQYKALLSEIDRAEEKCSQIEDTVLAAMMSADEKQKDIRIAEDALKQSELTLREQENSIKQEIERVDEEIKKISDMRAVCAKDIDEGALRLYERIMKNKGETKAVVAVIDNTCQGCFMKLPPNDVLEVRKSHKIQTCENCARILFWPYSEEI
ncbi:hypothetical protein KDK77_02895 [bacterium]|nr:hypothetical protein [bacterium]MCP5461767.1 hypothetical protein [bacterium]